jgi:hypothetical protein
MALTSHFLVEEVRDCGGNVHLLNTLVAYQFADAVKGQSFNKKYNSMIKILASLFRVLLDIGYSFS